MDNFCLDLYQKAFICLNLMIEILEKCVKYIQS